MKSAQGSGDEMYVVIGAGGFLGSHIIKSVLENTTENILAASKCGEVYSGDNRRVNVFPGDLTDFDYLKQLAEKINSQKNVKIIYTAACHNIDYVAQKPDIAALLNIKVPEKFLPMLRETEKILFTSSDTVYGDGGDYLFKEDDELSPLSIYGEQKAQAEKVFISHGGTALRLPLMFSKSIAPTKKHFCDTLFENLQNRKMTQLVTGAVRSTLDYGTVADIVVKLCNEASLPSVINISGDESFSKCELGVRFASCNGLNTALIESVAAFGEPPKTGAKRADSTLMSNELLKKILKTNEIKIKF